MMASTGMFRRVLLNNWRTMQSRNFTISRVLKEDGAVHPRYFKIKELQKDYQVDNGLRIHQRHGPTHKMINYFIYGLTAWCTVLTCKLYYEKIAPPKN